MNLAKRANNDFIDSHRLPARHGLEQREAHSAERIVTDFVVPPARTVPTSQATRPTEIPWEKKPSRGLPADLPHVIPASRNARLIEEELHRVLRSRIFSKSFRLKCLLEHIITRWLAGEINQLDGYNLAIEVFGRGESFEPGLDPIVRVEVSRLRNHLALYYAGEGASDLLRIEIPKGSYIPVAHEQLVAGSLGSGLTEARRTTVMVLPFVPSGGAQSADAAHAIAISDDLIYLLTRSGGVRVTSRVSSAHLDRSLDARQLGEHFGAHFIIEGTIALAAEECHIIVHLAETANGYNLWSRRYRAQTNSLSNAVEQIHDELLHEVRKNSLVP